MKVIIENNIAYATFGNLRNGELFSFSPLDYEDIHVCLKLTETSAFDLSRNLMYNVPVNMDAYSPVVRIKGHLAVEGFMMEGAKE